MLMKISIFLHAVAKAGECTISFRSEIEVIRKLILVVGFCYWNHSRSLIWCAELAVQVLLLYTQGNEARYE